MFPTISLQRHSEQATTCFVWRGSRLLYTKKAAVARNYPKLIEMEAEAASSPELLINGDALKSNLMSIHYVRSLMAISVGICAGIAGLTNSSGFLLYICMHFITSLCLFLRMNGNVQEYLQPGTNALWFALDGLTGQGLSFVMFWTLSFAMIHIF